ncbi:MAG TPA: hypothetical protein VF541_17935 [Longimicrobium sp.]|jgi:hypothetical protein
MRAIGFHGTSIERAERILVAGFQISRNDWDWLGDGAYFFQDGRARAAEWARERFGNQAAVVGAEIELDGCIDLLDITWERVLANAHARYVEQLALTGAPLPAQTRGAHRLARHVLNYLAGRMAEDGMLVRTVRAAFAEGEPIYPGSALLSRSHVQIAVRDLSAIVRAWRVNEEDLDARS